MKGTKTVAAVAKHFGMSFVEAKEMLDSFVAAGIFTRYDDKGFYFGQQTIDLFDGMSKDPVIAEQQMRMLVDLVAGTGNAN